MQVRVPQIARDVLARNPDYPPAIAEAVERLARDVEQDAPLPPPRAPGPDMPAWAAYHEERARETWLDAEWFRAELTFYRELVHACRFWESGRDPFAPAKEEELSGDRPWSRLEQAMQMAGQTREQRVGALLEASLWGNRVDLSYTVAASRVHSAHGDLLVDERSAAIDRMAQHDTHVHVVADNTGTELALDLALVGAVLEDPRARVTIHLKMQPMFVSDAMPCDVWRLLEQMRARPGVLRSLADHLDAAFAADRLALVPDPFWTGPRFLWDAPAHVHAALASATVVVMKGDANYRRLIGDALWPAATTLAHVCAYLEAPLVCLRTMKSDPVVGLPEGLADRLDATEPRWRIDGQRGLLQTYLP